MLAHNKKHDIKTQFAKDIQNHGIDVRHDEGLYRHVVFSRPGTSCYMFSLTTTPGRLIYAGDMGCFVFERLLDMFEFFRGEREPNFGYWHEKLVAVSSTGGSSERSVERFRENLESYLEDKDELTPSQLEGVKDFIEDVCDQYEDEGPDAAYRTVMDFCLESLNSEPDYTKNHRPFFSDFWEYSDAVYSYQYEWACYAIRWAIDRYDAHKVEARDAHAKRLIPDDWFVPAKEIA